MKKNRRCFVFALAIMLAVVAVPAFAAEPMTLSGVWLREGHTKKTMGGATTNEKLYYYFSPGGVSGTAVGIAVIPDIVGGQQEIPFKGTWDFEEKDGKQLFCVYGVSVFQNRWVGGRETLPYQMDYRFYTEGGMEKMELYMDDGYKEVWTKIGTKLTDLPELGVLGKEGSTGGRFWAQNGVVVK